MCLELCLQQHSSVSLCLCLSQRLWKNGLAGVDTRRERYCKFVSFHQFSELTENAVYMQCCWVVEGVSATRETTVSNELLLT